jgi:hypothetical protein
MAALNRHAISGQTGLWINPPVASAARDIYFETGGSADDAA